MSSQNLSSQNLKSILSGGKNENIKERVDILDIIFFILVILQIINVIIHLLYGNNSCVCVYI